MEFVYRLIMFLGVASTILLIGTTILLRVGHRRSPGWALIAIALLAVCSGTAAAKATHFGSSLSKDPDWFFIIFWASLWFWDLYDLVRGLRMLIKNGGDLEFALPRRWPREWTCVGAALLSMGTMLTLCILVLAAKEAWWWLTVVGLTLCIAGNGYAAMKYAGVFELRKNGIVARFRLTPWADVFERYEWSTFKSGEPLLRLRTKERQLLIALDPNPAVDSILAAHGLERML